LSCLLAFVLTFYIGWLCATGWQSGVAAVSYLCGTVIQSLFILNISSYIPEAWHGTLLTICIVTIAVIFNTVLAKKLPFVEGLLATIHFLGIGVLIPVWVLSPERKGGSPLVEFYNPGGWSSNGVATLVSILYSVTALLGFDCSVHMGLCFALPPSLIPIHLHAL
jgi:amino acid transporter